MRLQSGDFRRLSGDLARAPALLEAKAYLAQALESLRQSDDPVDTLLLLRALRGTGYAGRANQQQALDAVGSWLEQRLRRDLAVSSQQLRLELGWLRRMAIAQRKESPAARKAPRDEQPTAQTRAHHDTRAPRHGPGNKPDAPAFGQNLDRLRLDRECALQPAQPQSEATAQTRGRQVPAAPTELPEVFEVFFTDIRDVREARRKAKEREKKRKQNSELKKQDKPPKDRLLALRPAEAALVPLVTNLTCFLFATEGMNELFAATDARGGVTPAFYVRRAEIGEQDGKRVAQRIWLAPPVLSKK